MSNNSPDLVVFCADLFFAFADYREAYQAYIEEIALFKSEGVDRFREAEESDSGRMYELKVRLEEGKKLLGKELANLAIAPSEASDRWVVDKIVDYAVMRLSQKNEKEKTPLLDILSDGISF